MSEVRTCKREAITGLDLVMDMQRAQLKVEIDIRDTSCRMCPDKYCCQKYLSTFSVLELQTLKEHCGDLAVQKAISETVKNLTI